MFDERTELLQFEYNFVVAVISDSSFCNYVADIINPEFIMDLDYRYVYQTVLRMNKRNHPVTFMSVVETIRMDTAISDEKISFYEEMLIPLTRSEMRLLVDSALSFVLPRIEREVSRSVVDKALATSMTLSEQGKYDEVFALFKQLEGQALFRKVKVNEFMPTLGLEEEDRQLEEGLKKTGISLGISGKLDNGIIHRIDDDLFYKGIARGQVAIVACETKLGKTTLLLNIGVFQVLSGMNIDFYSLETDVSYLMYRGLSSIANLPTDLMRDNPKKLMGKAKKELSKYPDRGRFRFLRYPPEQLTTAMIAANTNQAKKSGRMVDVVIVDYTDLMASQGQREDDTSKVKRLSRELSSVAVENDLALITASQVGRQAFGKKDVGAGDVTGSIARVFGCDIFLLMYQEIEVIQNPSGEETVITKVKIRQDRTRYGKMGKSVLLEANRETGRMFNLLP